MAQKISSTAKVAIAKRWNDHIKSWRVSGLSQSAYCREHGLRRKGLVYWLKKERNKINLQLIPVPIQAVAVRDIPVDSFSGLRLKFENKSTLEISRSFDSETFARVVKIINEL